ncbi:hypothetical protein FQN60_001288 [Etheostoma spectabile]|uniref:LRRCT domain-containing protein n=1 Tax=Etheostoma spectabile TaxID=54343 RepID=A0A5J5D3Z4_9PERO|nr:hypothetical protein FQN60_001288 [Etheostoma spectabile]
MNSVVELQLEENPWNCSCELIALKTWLESISYTALVGDVVCEFPFRLHGRDLDEVSKQELCPRRAIAEYEMQPLPHLSTDAYYRTTPAHVTASFTSSGIARSSSRPTKGPHQSRKLKSRPTARIPSNKPQNYGQIISYQTKSPVPLDCPTACTCNLQISDLGLNVNCQERKIEHISDLNPKPYNPKKILNLRNNHLRYLPVSGVLDQLTALVQVDLFENPWDCSCSILELKMWLEQLSTGTVINNVICGSPKRLAGEDMRYIKPANFCPNNSDILASIIPPSEESFPGSTITIETSLDFDTQSSAIPLSVMILALLLMFIVSVFVAAGLFVVMKKRHQKSQNDHNNSMNACISSLNMEYGLYKKGSIPKVRTSAGHVYEYIPPPTESTCRTSAQTPTESKSADRFRDFDELSSAFLGNSDEEAASNVISSEYSATTPEPPNKPSSSYQGDQCYYRDVHEPDKHTRYSNTLPCRHAAHLSNLGKMCSFSIDSGHDTAAEQTLGVTGEPTVTLITANAFGLLFCNFTAKDMHRKPLLMAKLHNRVASQLQLPPLHGRKAQQLLYRLSSGVEMYFQVNGASVGENHSFTYKLLSSRRSCRADSAS